MSLRGWHRSCALIGLACGLGLCGGLCGLAAMIGPARAAADDPPALAVGGGGTAPSVPLPPSVGPVDRVPADREGYRKLVRDEAARDGLPPDIADAVAEVESNYHPEVVGGAGEIGLMQVLPSTARLLGFAGTDADLARPDINVRYGVAYLAQAWRLAGGDICTATMKYRAGHGETRFSYLSVSYCLRVRAALYARGYPVAGVVPTPTFGEPGRARGPLRLGGTRGLDLVGLNSQLRALADAVSARSGFSAAR